MAIGIVYATEKEAQPFIARTSAIQTTSRPLPTFKLPARVHPACVLAVSGMGKVAASMAATHLVVKHQAQVLISVGVCGCLNDGADWPQGQLLRVARAAEGDCDRLGQPAAPIDCDPEWFADLAAGRLITCDRPVFDAQLRAQLAAAGDLADMEGAAVAHVAQAFNITCAMLKAVSDNAGEAGRGQLNRNLEPLAECIAERLLAELQRQSVTKST